MNLGIIHKKLGNLEQACDAILKSLQLKPDNRDAYFNLGGIYRDLGQLKKAETSLRKAISLSPGYRQGHLALGKILLESGRHRLGLEEERKGGGVIIFNADKGYFLK